MPQLKSPASGAGEPKTGLAWYRGIVAVGQELYWLIALAVPVIVTYFKAPDEGDAPAG